MDSEVILTAEGTDPADALAARVAEELAAAWRDGGRPRADEYLDRHPELADHPQAAIRLIYEEICQRQGRGETVVSSEVIARFPQWESEIGFLLQCQRVMRPPLTAPSFPEVGESLGGVRLLAELGRGAVGRVFLGAQPALADRPLVVKVTPCDGQEHLTLARLQHTNIVPLYAVQEFAERNLRVMTMPFLGGGTLAQLLEKLSARPPETRTGRDLLAALDELHAWSPFAVLDRGPARDYLAAASYTDALCWVGMRLAEALEYAHERNLLHLDLKPSNVVLAADGEPMLLDFHLAREPIRPEAVATDWIGGTTGYMSPEQRQALAALREGRTVPGAVDGRSDVYSLGLVLYEALGGIAPTSTDVDPPRLERCNAGVSTGLADIVHKCLVPDPAGRYPGPAALAEDLRRHLAHRPLAGVANRSLAERWRKWRWRRPQALPQLRILLAVLLTVAATAGLAVRQGLLRHEAARAALADGRQHLADRDYDTAASAFGRGLHLVEGLPGAADLRQSLREELQRVGRARAVRELHVLVDRLRLSVDPAGLSPEAAHRLAERCREAWDQRDDLLAAAAEALGPAEGEELRTDLLDLALLGADLHVRAAGADPQADAHRQALEVLRQAEALLGPSTALAREAESHAAALGVRESAGEARHPDREAPPRTAWEHYALGRYLLRTGNARGATSEFEQAARQQPQAFWPHFYQGVSQYRLRRYEEALTAFHVCVALAPERAECFYNRGLAEHALGRLGPALRDYDEALRLNPELAAALLKRGQVHRQQARYPAALADLRQALELGADPGTAHYELALVHRALNDRTAAKTQVRQALRHDPGRPEVLSLQRLLEAER